MEFNVVVAATVTVEADSPDQADQIVLDAVGTAGGVQDYIVRETSQDIGLSS